MSPSLQKGEENKHDQLEKGEGIEVWIIYSFITYCNENEPKTDPQDSTIPSITAFCPMYNTGLCDY